MGEPGILSGLYGNGRIVEIMTEEELGDKFEGPAHSPYYFFTCKVCFGPVYRAHREKHLTWHDELARVAREADHAYTWTSVIG